MNLVAQRCGNLGNTVDSNGVPNIASGGQAIGTAIIANPVLDETANQALVVSDVTYTAGNAVFTITNALANITYELVDDNGRFVVSTSHRYSRS